MSENFEKIEGLKKSLEADAIALIAEFRKRITGAANEVIQNVYTDFVPHIESDAWTNYRELLRREMEGGWYKRTNDTLEGRWARAVRDMILREHRADIIAELNQDLVAENKELKEKIERMNDYRLLK